MATTIVTTRPSGGGQPSNTYLTALSTISGTGIYVVTGPTTAALRTITVAAGQLVINDPDGVAGNPRIGLSPTGVLPGSYTNANITVDGFGRITAAASGSSSGGVSQIIAGTNVTISPVGGTGAVTINSTGGGSSLQLYAENPVAPTAPSATGVNSIALLSTSQAEAQDSLAIGVQSVARIQGGVVQASGRFGSSGDAQIGRYTVRTVTVNAIATEMFVDGTAGSVRLIMPDDATWTFKATITGHRTDATDGHAGFTIEGVIYRVAGASSVALQGKTSVDTIARANTPWKVAAAADTTNGSLKITVTGEAGKTIRWLALVETVEITN